MTNVPNIVTRRLRVRTGDQSHPDPNLMTAFIERSLSPREQASVLDHLAHCAGCRELMATSLPERFDSVAVAGSISARRSWLSSGVLRWVAAGACVVVVGAAVGLHYGSSGHQSSITTKDVAVQQPAAAPSQSLNIPAQSAKQSANQVPTSNPAPSKRLKARADRDSNDLSTANAPAAESMQAGKKLGLQERGKAKSTAPTPFLAKAAPAAENVEIIPGRTKDESELAPTVRMSPALSGSASRQMLPSTAMIARAAVIPSNVIPRWTLTSDGMLQRSIDAGKTWETILVASPGNFRALTANGFDIWVGGAKGALYHSMDAGQHWMQVLPTVDGTSLSSDITGIEFNDLLHGTLTTADKQTWTTVDAGRTWTRQ